MTEVYIAKAPLKKKTRWIKGELNPVDSITVEDKPALESLLVEVFEDRNPNPCEHCSNNPMNNPYASGVCNCILPYLNNVIY